MSIQLQFIILPIVTLILIGLTVLFAWLDRGWFEIWGLLAFVVGLFGAILLVITLIMFVPYNVKYLTYNHVQGSVVSVSNHFQTGSGDATGSEYILRLAGHEGVYNVQDDRIAGVKAGTHVDLTCTVQWVYQGQDQNNCFVRSW